MSGSDPSTKVLSDNRQAGHNFFLQDRYEAGIALTGTEVKAAKAGKVQLRDAYASIENHEAWLLNAHISEYSHGNRFNHSPVRQRKLLLHRREIEKLHAAIREKGLSIVPTKLYLKNGRIKCEIAVAKGKKFHDKRETERAKTAEAEARDAIRASKMRS
ncbi:MAG TPA: SsrA-binding protein SmpB [Bryobacteraceae bacterium]|nr:SsrA-binding protein SmpB [Bryobacteraceae bacterium]